MIPFRSERLPLELICRGPKPGPHRVAVSVVQDSSWVERCGEKLEVREEAILVSREPGLDLETRAVIVNPGGPSQGGRATLLEQPPF